MVTISGALSAAQAQDYYENEYSNPALTQAEYYQERGEGNGEWFGELAEEWGLTGEVNGEEFYRVIEGQHPVTGEQLVDHVESRKYINRYGREVKTSEHRAGWDATFSAPKSISILAYMSGDPELKKAIWQAHAESVTDSLREMENYACARLGNGKWEKSGNFIMSVFHHERARPDEENGYAAPDIHSHAVIMNMTRGTDGRVHAMQEIEFFRSQTYLTAIYRTRMSERMQKLGTDLLVDLETGAPEVKGISRAYIEAASVRSDEIERKAKEIRERLEAEGHTVKEGAGLKQAAAKLNRKTKDYEIEEMTRHDGELEKQFGFEAHEAARAARERGPVLRTAEEIERWAKEAVNYGIEHVMEREAVNDYRALMTSALKRNLTFTTYDAVMAEARQREQRGELVRIDREERMSERTSQKMLDLERRNIRTMLEGKGTVISMAVGETAEKLIAQISYRQNIKLNSDQYNAVLALLENRDRIVALQGRAGAGKTTAIRVFREAAERSGYAVFGVAPTTMASKELGKSGIRSQTLESFLRSAGQGGEGKRLVVLDESSLSDTKRINALFRRVGPEDQILLLGDRVQHQAVEAGAPFEQFQKRGIETIWIKQVVRQKEPGYKEAVKLLHDGKIRDAINLLERQGRIIEVENDDDRFHAVAAAFVARPAGNLAVAPGNRERAAINAIIHRMLQDGGMIDKEDHRTTVLINRDDMTGADRKFAGRYKPGQDIVRYREGSDVYGIGQGEYGRVVAQDYEQNTLTVKLDDGRAVVYDPRRLYGVEVFKEAERNFSVGDRIRFRRPFERKAANGELATIEKIEGKQFAVKLQDGQRVMVDTGRFRHFDYGYAVTSYLSQGQTSAREIVHIDTRMSHVLVNQRMLQVALTRGVEDVLIVTNSIDDLIGAVERRKDKEIALDALEVSERIKENRAGAYASAPLNFDFRQAGRLAKDGDGGLWQRSAHGDPQPRWEQREGKREPKTFTKRVVQHQFSEREKPAQQRLIRVRRKDPCPICNKPDWCSVSADRAIAICMRVTSEYEAKNGGYVHILDPARQSRQPKLGTVEVTQHERANIKERHEVNQALLEALKLKERDLRSLLARGLDEASIERNGYKSIPLPSAIDALMVRFKGRDLAGIPGFYRDEGIWRLNIGEWKDKDGLVRSFHQGFLIPVRDIRGRIEGFQIRRAEVKRDEPRYIWLSTSSKEEGASSGAPVHYRNIEQARKSGQAIITEGALKADVSADLLGGQCAVIAGAGVLSFPEAFGHRLRAQLPELRQAVIAIDADAGRTPEVQKGLDRLSEILWDAGLDVRELRWEESQGKGLDDYLLKDPAHRNEVKEFLRESLASLDRGEVSVANLVTHERSKLQDELRQHNREIVW
ncbi:MAG: relaxase domain-containing protein [Acidobacteria bacterium]|nr:relaxase domain-containing protein [Acidobacteriota bacterium]